MIVPAIIVTNVFFGITLSQPYVSLMLATRYSILYDLQNDQRAKRMQKMAPRFARRFRKKYALIIHIAATLAIAAAFLLNPTLA